MFNYMVFFNGKNHTLQAPTSMAAQTAAAAWFKVPAKKQHMIAVVFIDRAVDTASL